MTDAGGETGHRGAVADRAPDNFGRDELREERDDREVIELLQELRVASLGVQVLFGFLLSLPFTTHFVRLDSDQRLLYMTTLLLAAGSHRTPHRSRGGPPPGVPPAQEGAGRPSGQCHGDSRIGPGGPLDQRRRLAGVECRRPGCGIRPVRPHGRGVRSPVARGAGARTPQVGSRREPVGLRDDPRFR